MSVADHFDHTPDAGFVRRYDTSSARRQFQLSLILMVVLATAAFLLGTLIRFDDGAVAGPVMTPGSISAPVTAPIKAVPKRARSIENEFAGRLVRIEG